MKTETTSSPEKPDNSEHDRHISWFLHFMELFIHEVSDDVQREELENALIRLREHKYAER